MNHKRVSVTVSTIRNMVRLKKVICSTAGLLHWVALYSEGAYVVVFTCVSAGCSCG